MADADVEVPKSNKDLNEVAGEARSAPSKNDGISCFIIPDSMADIFGDFYKPMPNDMTKHSHRV